MIENLMGAIFHFLKTLGLFGAFLSMLIENMGIPLPTEIGYLIGQELVNLQKYSYLFVLIILTLGHLTGALVAYWIGRWGDSILTKRLKKSPKIVALHQKLTKWYNRYGFLTIFITRFIGYIRPWSSFVAGFAEVKLWPFIFWTALGSLIFNIANLYFASVLIAVWRKYTTYHLVFSGIIFLLFFGFLIYWLIKNLKRNSHQ